MMQVVKANPYVSSEMGSTGNASYMLIRQFQFPYNYNERKDRHLIQDHDRIEQRNYEFARKCFAKHTRKGSMGLGDWAKVATNEQILAFLEEMLQADKTAKWTGYRIMGTVHRGHGGAVYTLELFAKNPDTQTEVYTGQDAPNVIKRAGCL